MTIFFFFAVACCSAIILCPGQDIQPVTLKPVVFEVPQFPNEDPERVHQPVVPGGHIAIQKKLVFPDLLSVAAFYQPGIAVASSVIKASSLLVKDHLIHNYPSHNFW